MCQIHVIKKDTLDLYCKDVEWHLDLAADTNEHGSAALFINRDGEHSIIRSMNWKFISDFMLINDDWDTAIIHQRYTTQGETNLTNTHLWQVDNMFYCHNGILESKDAAHFEVDSMLIGHHLKVGGIWEAIAFCQSEEYANTIIVDLESKFFWVSRSQDNSLYTDGNGQYSTSKLDGIIDIPVHKNTVAQHKIDCKDFEVEDWANNWSYPMTTYDRSKSPIIIGGNGGGSFSDPHASSGVRAYKAAAGEKMDYNPETGKMSVPSARQTEDPAHVDPAMNLTTEELEQLIYKASADQNSELEQRYTYLLEKKEGNG